MNSQKMHAPEPLISGTMAVPGDEVYKQASKPYNLLDKDI